MHSEDGMAADCVPLPYEVLKRLADASSTKSAHQPRRLRITSKPPVTIEWE